MNEPMNLDRFARLADAYGSSIARWPDAERRAAERLAAQPGARAILEQASGLDARLDAWRVAGPSRDLGLRIVSTAPVSPVTWSVRARLWWSGLGVTAALAGAAAGSLAAASVSPVAVSWDGGSAFGDLNGEGAP